jgi:NRPS condensation-like uncharacterized protein
VILDRAVTFLSPMADLMIQLELEFDGRLDAERLAAAMRLAMDARPELGCRLRPTWWGGWWERLDDAAMRAGFEVAADEVAYEAFRVRPNDPERGPQVRACLWPAPGGDRLLLKVCHEVADAGGTKAVGALVAGTYARLAREPGYAPEPRIDRAARSAWQLVRRVPLRALPGIWLDSIRETWRGAHPPGTVRLPVADRPEGQPAFVVRDLGPERVAALRGYGRARGATLNDLLVAAVLRVLDAAGLRGPGAALRLVTTADMRRWHLPPGHPPVIANLSAMLFDRWDIEPSAGFEAVLDAVSARYRRRKERGIGLAAFVGSVPVAKVVPRAWLASVFRRGWDRAVRDGTYSNGMTNMGPIPPEATTFGSPARAARLLPPPAIPPQCLLGASGYAGALTLSAGVCPDAMREVSGGALLDRIVAELPG